MKRFFTRGLMLSAALAATLAASAQAGSVTGNPLGDGWGHIGNSLELGTFTRSNSTSYDKLFDFDVYSTSLLLESGSALLGNGWQVGDLILGVGATVANSASLNANARVLVKYGAGDATFSASSYAPTPGGTLSGDGAGSTSASGNGGVVVDTPQIWGGDTPWFNSTNEGAILLIDGSTQPAGDPKGRPAHATRYWNGGADSTNGGNRGLDPLGVAKMIYQLDGTSGLLSSFENYLNVSLLAREGNGIGVNHPAVGDGFVLSFQNVSVDYTDAYGKILDSAAIPEPSSLVLASLGLGGLVFAARRRARAWA